jgi:subtilisin family serine protease
MLGSVGGTACTSQPLPGLEEPLGTAQARQVAAPAEPSALSPFATRPPTFRASGGHAARVLVKFKSDGPSAVTECPARWLTEQRSFATATADHSTSLDALIHVSGVQHALALTPGRAGLSTAQAQSLLQARISAAKTRYTARAARAAPSGPVRAGQPGDLTNVYLLELAADADAGAVARAFARDPHVDYAQINGQARFAATPNDPFYATSGSWGQSFDDLWNLKRIGASQAWDTTQGQNVVVAVVDSGLDLTHPDIAANLWTNPGELAANQQDDDQNGYVDDVHGYDFVNASGDPSDDFGHGTHVSGIVAAVGNNGQGVIGVAPRASLMALKALDQSGDGNFDALAAAIVYAAENGADVINNSWACATPCPSNPVIEDAVALAHDLGAVVVFAAGNSQDDVSNYSPQNQADVIVVAASDTNDDRAPFSNFGDLDVAAPGSAPPVAPPDFEPDRAILSLKSADCDVSLCPAGLVVGGSYLRQAGTSMAAPHVAGLAALLLAENPALSPEEVRQAIRHTADASGQSGWGTSFGYGRIDAARAVLEPRPLGVLITAPTASTRLSALSSVAISGTAAGTGFSSYRVEDGLGSAPSSFALIATSTLPVTNGELASWNVGTALDGVHTLRVVATTTDGRSYEDRQTVTVANVSITAPASGPDSFVHSGALVSVIGTVSPASFTNFSLGIADSTGAGLPSANVTLAGGGVSPIRNGLLASWDTTGAANDRYTLTLTAVTALGQTYVERRHIIVDDSMHPGWPQLVTVSGLSITDQLTAADVDGDGAAELLFGYGASISVFKQSGAQLSGWPQSIATATQKAPAVGDVTGDGKPEVVGANNDGAIFVWGSDGTAIAGWPQQKMAGRASLALEDVDGDGVRDILATDSDGNVDVMHGDGSSLPGWPLALTPGQVLSPPAIGDVNDDGQQEILVASEATPTELFLLSSLGVILPGWPKSLAVPSGFFSASPPVLGDVDGDGRLDIVVGALDGTVHAFHDDGTELTGWPRSTGASGANSPTLGDVDGDGRLDVVAGGSTDSSGAYLRDSLNAWRGRGLPLSGFPVSVAADQDTLTSDYFFGFGAAALADVDGDGRVDVVAASDTFSSSPSQYARMSSLRAYGANGELLAGFPRLTNALGAFSTDTAAIADFDGDGKLELAWVDWDGVDPSAYLYLWDLDAPATAHAPWPQFQHDAAHTGRADAGPLPAPTGLQATPGAAQVTLSWNRVRGATSYRLLRTTTSGSGYVLVGFGILTTSFVNAGLSDASKYYYVVRAVNAQGSSMNSSEVAAQPGGLAPPPPAGVVASAGSGKITLSWSPSAGATTYTVFRSTTSGSGYVIVTLGLNATSFVNSGLTNGVTYYYVVVARNSAGTSPNSLQVSAQPGP